MSNATKPVMSQFVIYDHPSDYPDHFVVRRWDIMPDSLKPDQECKIANSLVEARSLVPHGYHRLPRAKNDDPKIVEIWI